ncbi:hypothetical protein M569_01678, partial [Genlisea aurea]
IGLQEWQGCGSASPVPSMVCRVIRDLKLLEMEIDVPMTFDGNHGMLSGDFKVQEDKKLRQKYASIADPEEKLQYFSARQIACRLLGSRGYLCRKCWLAETDCMCSKVQVSTLWQRLHIWLYMHPKDFLRQNNTGKLLWQVFGVPAASLCLFGIAEHEDMMWNKLVHAGRKRVWYLYPVKSAPTVSIEGEVFSCLRDIKSEAPFEEDDTLHFILLDGTWNNSTAMLRRLQNRAIKLWGEELCCLSLNTGIACMHKLRPQPSCDRTCTAGAAIGLLRELHRVPELRSVGLETQAEALENTLEVLLEALTTRRSRMGRLV